MKRAHAAMLLPLAVLTGLLVAACASVGRPEGGPRDVDPPEFVRSVPAPGTVEFKGHKLMLYFNENIQVDNPMEKVVVSPAQRNSPVVTANGHRLTVDLRDTLIPDATYTIDFADAIKDLNEGNVLDGFAFDFATGPTIDSLRISGMVFQASNLEPAQGMLVGAYYERPDSAITTTTFDRITKTNQLGQFTLRNLKEGSYRVYALKDNNRDFHWDRSEDIAFLDSLVVPRVEYTEAPDTIFNPATGEVDSIGTRLTPHYYPNDLILMWFNEEYLAQHLKEYKRLDERRLQFVLGAPTDTLPSFRLLNGEAAGDSIGKWAVLHANASLDSLEYWIRDPRILQQDTLMLEARYQSLDSAEHLVWATDTLRITLRRPKVKEKKGSADTDTVAPKIEFLDLKMLTPSQADINKPLILSTATPRQSIDTAGIRLQMMVDTLWRDIPPPQFSPRAPLDPLIMHADYRWTPGARYRLIVDSAAITDIYGHHNAPLNQEFKVKEESDYSALFFNISGLDGPAFVQLLSSQDKPVASAPVDSTGVAALRYLKPGTYYARIVLDRNSNGRWDTGHLLDSIQPEEVLYYPKGLALKKNWEVEQAWDIYAEPLDRQKPSAVKKNKPPMKAGEKPLEEDEIYDPENPDGTDQFGNYTNPFDPNANRKSRDARNGLSNRL